MMRATGFVLGSLLMLAVFLRVLDAGISPMLVKDVVGRTTDTPTQTTDPIPAEDTPAENVADNAVLPEADTASLDDGGLDVTDRALALDPQSWNQSMAAFETADRNNVMPVSRYQVWSPFHSRWAAEGFAQRLTVATDVPMEVIDAGPGNYQVVFSYRDDGERQAMVERIETVTGLELE